MTATRYDLSIKQGEDVDFTVTVYADAAQTVPQVITGWTAKMQIRDVPGGSILADSASSITLTINGPAGQVTVHIAASITSGFTWTQGQYDLYVMGPSNIPTKCVVFGDATVHPRITV